VNFVDLILVLLVVLSLVRGVRLGAVMQVLSFGGFWLGLLLGALLAPKIADLFSSNFSRAVVSIVVLFGMAALVGGVGRQLGVRAWEMIRRVHLGPADSAVGAVVAAVATLLAAWIVAGMLINTSLPRVSRAINGSAIIRRIDTLLPPAPGVFSRIQQLLNTHGFPQVFAGLTPQGALPPVKAAGPPVVSAAIAHAGNSTVKIVSHGCGEILEGSGFVVAPNTIVTNAHVIAGTTSIDIQDTGGVQPARPIWFDPNFDLAVLRTPRPLAGRPLTIDTSAVPRGTPAVVLGFPEGGDFNAQPAGVDQQFEAQGRNIYGTGLTLRSVYEIAALVRPGNSGGPLVLADGTVIGVVFSTSATQNDIGYALASPQVQKEVQSAERADTPTGTGNCAD
jgi:S1-C subfamily serine protease